MEITRGDGGGGITGERGEGSSHRPCIKDPWMWTIGWGLTEGGWAGESNRENVGQM